MWRKRKWGDDTNGEKYGGRENWVTIFTVNNVAEDKLGDDTYGKECGGGENGVTILTGNNVAEEKMW